MTLLPGSDIVRRTMADFKYVDGASVLKPVFKTGYSSASLH
jgi:hypothetical protein